MAREIEKKFLVKAGAWRNEKGTPYRQGYLNSVKERVVRVRTINDKAYLTIKGLTVGASRLEFEYEIPKPDLVQEEVTGDPRYFNSDLIKNPYKMW